MSSVQKSTSKSEDFALDDINNIILSKAVKKEPMKNTPAAEPLQVTTRAKSGSKRKKSSEPEGDLLDIEKRLHDALTKEFGHVKLYYEKRMAEYEDTLAGMRSIADVKDKDMAKLEKEKKALEKTLREAEATASEQMKEVAEQAKLSAAKSVLQSMIKMAKEAGDPGFDRSSWDMASWEVALDNLGESTQELAIVVTGEAGSSGVQKEVEEMVVEGAEGGAGEGEGGEAAVV